MVPKRLSFAAMLATSIAACALPALSSATERPARAEPLITASCDWPNNVFVSSEWSPSVLADPRTLQKLLARSAPRSRVCCLGRAFRHSNHT
jgi:hypothetical protein